MGGVEAWEGVGGVEAWEVWRHGGHRRRGGMEAQGHGRCGGMGCVKAVLPYQVTRGIQRDTKGYEGIQGQGQCMGGEGHTLQPLYPFVSLRIPSYPSRIPSSQRLRRRILSN